MPAARYWRAIGLQSYGGGPLELSAFHLYLSGARVDAAATLTSTAAPSTGALSSLQDVDPSTACRWLDVSMPGFALSWDFGVGNTQNVDAVRLGSGALQTEYLEQVMLQYSTDGVSWQGDGVVLGRFDWPGANTLSPAPVAGDANFGSVQLLLHMDGANGGTSFPDSSANARTITAFGSAQTSTAQSKFGGASGYFNGGSHLVCPYSDAFNFAGSEWCVEFFVRWAGGSADVVSRRAGGIVAAWEVKINGSGNIYVLIGNSNLSTWAFVHTFSGVAVTQNVWQHVAVCGSGGTIRAYVEGVAASNPISGTVVSVGTQDLYIGRGGDSFLTGYLDDLRITKGAARYTANFSPPASAFPDQGGSSFLPLILRPNVLQEARIVSGGAAGPAGTVLGSPTVVRDLQDFGLYRIPNPRWVKEKALPANIPLRRRVQLYNQRDRRLVRETWSDAVTGDYAFDYIRGGDGSTYFVVGFDHTGQYRGVIADNLTPEPMP